ncbi:MAG: PAS domain S-box protein [Armatimonadota bacterium]|nr:PAS domain S-box protein [Armatimonadota bacterium]
MLRFLKNKISGALRIAIIYAIVSAGWILLSDLGISQLGGGLEPKTSIVKGWFFVAVTAVLLYLLIRQDSARTVKAESETRLLFDSVNDAIYMFRINRDGTPGLIIDANDAAIERLRYTCDELRRKTPWDIMTPEALSAIKPALEMRKRTGSAVFESVHVTKDGRRIPVEISSRITRIGGAVIGVNIARDVTERKRAEEDRRRETLALERDKRRFYKETILAVTSDKFELGDPDEADQWLERAEFLDKVVTGEDFSRVRRAVVAYCRGKGLPEGSASELEIAVGEALGNALKHAGGGEALAGVRGDVVWVGVRDHGRGIDTFTIPKVALMPGFTTQASMGLGYTLILELCDHVRLATGPEGATVVMEKKLKPYSQVEQRIARHEAIE